MDIDKSTILKFDKPGPRYTSYPTAPEWSADISADHYVQKLKAFDRTDKTLSLYVHIPFCETLCYFCACTVKIRPQDDKYGNEYLDYLEKELDLVSRQLKRRKLIRQLHWGGGTPSFLSEEQMVRLYQMIDKHFDIDSSGEIAIEVDPRRVTRSKVETLRALGFNRISIGLQDFNADVQAAVNRIQPFEMVEEFNRWCRELKFESVNFDLIYGLPHQTAETFHATVEQVIGLKPSRIALYSFAYVPWLKKHQSKIQESQLPSNDQKLDIFLTARGQFLAAGYESIAMDHFALRDDELAVAFRQGTLHRNFMGYTVKPADEYIGVGLSSIGFLEKSFFQNYKTIHEYYRFLEQGQLPVERGKILTQDDTIRQWVIQSLMCQFRLDKMKFIQYFQKDFDQYFSSEQPHIGRCVEDGLLKYNGHVLEVTELGRVFIRNVCMVFDWYLRQKEGHQRFSRTV
jgi:oxygen-independent coproporphyrinogen-3 oxidase